MGAFGRVTFKCAACGGETFSDAKQPESEGYITCDGCGALIKGADVQAARERAQHEIHQLIIGAFKRPK